MRFEREINIYGDEVILKRFTANETSISVIQGEISAIISESELIELIDSSVTMYSKLASAIMDIDSLTINFSDLTTKYNTVSGQYTALDSKVAEYKASVDGLSANVSQISQNLTNNYSTTTAMNSAINLKINQFSTTVSETYATKSQLNNYSTTAQMNSAIKQKADEISTSVSATYATKTSVTTAQNNAVSTAKDYTDSAKSSALTTAKGYADDAEAAANANTANRLKSYSTTAQMNSAINQKANEISLEVSSIQTDLRDNYSTTYQTSTLISQTADSLTVMINQSKSDAEKVATNFMSFDAEGGLMIGNKIGGDYLGYKSQIKSDGFNIINEFGEVVSSYGEETIIGKQENNSHIKIKRSNIEMVAYDGNVTTFTSDGIRFGDDGYIMSAPGQIGFSVLNVPSGNSLGVTAYYANGQRDRLFLDGEEIWTETAGINGNILRNNLFGAPPEQIISMENYENYIILGNLRGGTLTNFILCRCGNMVTLYFQINNITSGGGDITIFTIMQNILKPMNYSVHNAFVGKSDNYGYIGQFSDGHFTMAIGGNGVINSDNPAMLICTLTYICRGLS